MAPFLYTCCHCEVSEDNPGPATESHAIRREPSRARRASYQYPTHRTDLRANHHHRQTTLPLASMSASTVLDNSHISSHTAPTIMILHEEQHSRHQHSRVTTLQAQIQLEDIRHKTRTEALRQQIEDERVRHRVKGTSLHPRTRRQTLSDDCRHRDGRMEERTPARRLTRSHIVKWIEGLRSYSSSSYSNGQVEGNGHEGASGEHSASTGTARQAVTDDKVEDKVQNPEGTGDRLAVTDGKVEGKVQNSEVTGGYLAVDKAEGEQ